MDSQTSKTNLTEELNNLLNVPCANLGEVQSRCQWCMRIINMFFFAGILTREEYDNYKQKINDIYKEAVKQNMKIYV